VGNSLTLKRKLVGAGRGGVEVGMAVAPRGLRAMIGSHDRAWTMVTCVLLDSCWMPFLLDDQHG
jgi:hypothetical protein